jgi:hypothetical protein
VKFREPAQKGEMALARGGDSSKSSQERMVAQVNSSRTSACGYARR